MMERPDIAARFRALAAERPAQPALWAGETSWTFARLDRASDQIAAELTGRGLRTGDRIGLYCLNSPVFAAAYLGILKAGATVVPINLLLHPQEIAFLLQDSGARGLCHHPKLAEAAARVAESAAGLEFVLPLREGEEEGDSNPSARVAAAPAELAALLYTSGTTGQPKGAMLSHANLLANTASIMRALDLSPGHDRLLVVLPLFHAFAATVGLLTPLLYGLSLVIVERFEPRLVSAAIARHGATVFLGVPSMYRLLLRLDSTEVEQWRSVRFGISGGAALPQAVMSAFEARFGIPVLEGDGPTECGPVTCVNPLKGRRKPGSVGLPIPDVAMRIAGPEGQTLADGEPGEVCVRGPNVMRGYWRREAETAASFFGDWFRTGDLGYRDAEGYFFLVDRLKDLMIVNGMNVYPRIIEEVLHRHPDLAEAAVVGEPHPLHGEIPVAHVVAHPGKTPDPAALRQWCRQHLGRHEVPRRFLAHAALPRNATGKILKRELRRQGEIERGLDLPPAG